VHAEVWMELLAATPGYEVALRQTCGDLVARAVLSPPVELASCPQEKEHEAERVQRREEEEVDRDGPPSDLVRVGGGLAARRVRVLLPHLDRARARPRVGAKMKQLVRAADARRWPVGQAHALQDAMHLPPRAPRDEG